MQWREKERERMNRLWAKPFASLLVPLRVGWEEAQVREERRGLAIPSMVAKRMMGYRWGEIVGQGKRGRGSGFGEVRRVEWDEEFSLASLRCLYTRGSCMAVGHISVSRERGAPPKNQIECKNRINSSWQTRELCLPSWLARWLSTRGSTRSHDSTSYEREREKEKRDERPITSHISSYFAACPPLSSYAVCRAYEGSYCTLYRRMRLAWLQFCCKSEISSGVYTICCQHVLRVKPADINEAIGINKANISTFGVYLDLEVTSLPQWLIPVLDPCPPFCFEGSNIVNHLEVFIFQQPEFFKACFQIL